MNRLELHKVNLTNICIILSFLSLAPAAKPAFSQIPMGRTGSGESMKPYFDKRAFEAYEKRNAEITPWVEDDAMSNPDNAALLYYQAFVLIPDPNRSLDSKLNEVVYQGAESDRQVRTYLGHCLHLIELVDTASRIANCEWGIWQGSEPGPGSSVLTLRPKIVCVSRLLLIDALTLASDGHYRIALERCLTVRRMARHLNEDPRLYLIAYGPNRPVLLTIQRILGIMPQDAGTLTWLRGQLAVVHGARLSCAEWLQAKVRNYLDHFRTKPDMRRRIKNLLVEGSENEQIREKIRNFTDQQLLLYIRKAYEPYLDSIFNIVDSEIGYEQKCAQMEKLIEKLKEEYGSHPLYYEVIGPMNIPLIVKDYTTIQVNNVAHINGLKAAVDVYLEKAKTGELPDELPDGAPKDPFTGLYFVYEKTNEGFALRCQGKVYLEFRNKWLEFKVRK